MYDFLASAIYNFAMNICGFSFGTIWAYEPPIPPCLMNKVK